MGTTLAIQVACRGSLRLAAAAIVATGSAYRDERRTIETGPAAPLVDVTSPSEPREAEQPAPRYGQWVQDFRDLPVVSDHWAVEIRIRFDESCENAKPPRRLELGFESSLPDDSNQLPSMETNAMIPRGARFHVYRVEWRSHEVLAFVDGRMVAKHNAGFFAHELHFEPDCDDWLETQRATIDYVAFDSNRFPCAREESSNGVGWSHDAQPAELTSCMDQFAPKATRTVTRLSSGLTRVKFAPTSKSVEVPSSVFLHVSSGVGFDGSWLPEAVFGLLWDEPSA